MNCAQCTRPNDADSRFCVSCGTALWLPCRHCGAKNRPDWEYCAQCGDRLTGGSTAAAGGPHVEEPLDQLEIPSAKAQRGLERRPLTVMFCDLVGSTALSFRLDPEELGNVVLSYRQACQDAVARFGGYIARYLGDGVLVYFGYPHAHDDDEVRAIRAALAIMSNLKGVSDRFRTRIGSELRAHIGIHTGEVVAGDLGSGALLEQAAVVGETPNIAARLQERAGPGEIVVSHATLRVAQDRFVCEALGAIALKGIAEPLTSYKVIAEQASNPDLGSLGAKTSAPPLGRDEELGLLMKQWGRVREGSGQVALIGGEAGIGKTRLLQTLVAALAGAHCDVKVSHCSAYFVNSAFFPVVDLLRRELKLDVESAAAEVAERVADGLRSGMLPQPEAMSQILSLLSTAAPTVAPGVEISPQAQRERAIEWLINWIVGYSAARPLVLIVEDIHWADASTMEFLSLLLDQIASTKLFLLVTFRSEFQPPWPIRSHINHFTLTRLSSPHVRTLIGQLTKGRMLVDSLLEQVVSRTDGVPLFVEELVKMVEETGTLYPLPDGSVAHAATTPVMVPDTLRGSLVARLDRHETAKGIAQIAAVIGREISYKLIRAASGLGDFDLKSKLKTLVDAELLFQRGIPPNATYTFKHALIRDAAYQSLLKTQRTHYHKLIAEVMLEQFPGVSESHPELVARHYSDAAMGELAIPHWRKAGMRALEATANVEAAAHLQDGLAEIARLPGSKAWAAEEVSMQIALGTALTAIRGYGASEVERAYARAYDLCENLGDTQQLFTALTGLHTFYQVRGPLVTAREIALRLLEIANVAKDEPLVAQANRRLGWSLFCLGEMNLGKKHLDQALALFDSTRSREHRITYGAHPWVVGFANSAWLEWIVGFPDDGLRNSQRALSLARELKRPLPLAYALCMSAAMHQCRREPERTLELADETTRLASDNSMPYWVAWSSILKGWALSETGHVDEGILQLESGLQAYRATGAELFRPYSLALLAEALHSAGRLDEALSRLDEALASANQQQSQFYAVEIHRLRGNALLERDADGDGAEGSYREGLLLAQTQGSLALELRVALSLATLLLGKKNVREARSALDHTLGKFAQGFDTADSRAARSLIERLPE